MTMVIAWKSQCIQTVAILLLDQTYQEFGSHTIQLSRQ